MIVDFVTVAMTLHHAVPPVDLTGHRAGLEQAILSAESHGTAQVGGRVPALYPAVAVLPLGDERDHGMRGVPVELGAMGVGKARHIARVLDDGELHAETDPQVGNTVLACIAYGFDLPLDAALPEPAGNQDGVHGDEGAGPGLLDRLGV